jgi:hypothetical protein
MRMNRKWERNAQSRRQVMAIENNLVKVTAAASKNHGCKALTVPAVAEDRRFEKFTMKVMKSIC